MTSNGGPLRSPVSVAYQFCAQPLNAMSEDKILCAEEIAEQLRCSVAQAEDLMRRGELPAAKIGRGWITTYGELIEFVRQRIRAPRQRPAPAVLASIGQPSRRRGARCSGR